MADSSDPLEEFRVSLERVRILAEKLSDEGLVFDSRLLVHETQLSGAIVLLSGYFEAFLKNAVRSVLRAIASNAPLPDNLRSQHIKGAAKVLESSIRFGGVTPESVLARLHYALNEPTRTPREFVWEAFADTQSNPDKGAVARIADNLGVKQFWPTVFKHSLLVQKGHSEQTMLDSLTALIAKRNECAHTGRAITPPSTEEVKSYVVVLDGLAKGFTATLKESLLPP